METAIVWFQSKNLNNFDVLVKPSDELRDAFVRLRNEILTLEAIKEFVMLNQEIATFSILLFLTICSTNVPKKILDLGNFNSQQPLIRKDHIREISTCVWECRKRLQNRNFANLSKITLFTTIQHANKNDHQNFNEDEENDLLEVNSDEELLDVHDDDKSEKTNLEIMQSTWLNNFKRMKFVMTKHFVERLHERHFTSITNGQEFNLNALRTQIESTRNLEVRLSYQNLPRALRQYVTNCNQKGDLFEMLIEFNAHQLKYILDYDDENLLVKFVTFYQQKLRIEEN